MSFTDPLSVTISAVTTPLPRTEVDGDKSIYTSADGLLVVSADHSLTGGSRKRHVLRIDASKITSDPFKPAENVKVSTSCYVVFDTPPAGYTNTEVLAVYTGFKTMFTASSDAMITKLLGGES